MSAEALRRPGAPGPSLERAGFNLAGVLAAERYDALAPSGWRTAALLPGARSVLVLGCGGRAFGEAFAAAEGSAPVDPVDRFTEQVVRRAAADLAAGGAAVRTGFYWERHGGEFVDLIRLGRACGLGAPSRLGLLLHPVYGPWLSLRALLLTTAVLAATPPLADFDPCRGCPAPCAGACPGGAVGADAFDVVACAQTSAAHAPCREGCAARRACVLGRDHAYAPDLERLHRAAALAWAPTSPSA